MATAALNRILSIGKNNRNEKELRFDIVLAKEVKPTGEVFNNLTGVYKMNDKSMIEFYREGDLMFMKWNGQIREALSYKGNNEFSGGINNMTKAKFEITSDQKIKVMLQFYALILKKQLTLVGVKTFKY